VQDGAAAAQQIRVAESENGVNFAAKDAQHSQICQRCLGFTKQNRENKQALIKQNKNCKKFLNFAEKV
jgi:hypothetical protein